MSQSPWDALLTEHIRKYGRIHFTFAYKVLRDTGTAEDVCQDAFLRAWEYQDRIRSHEALRSWLAQTITRLAIDRVRDRGSERRAMIARRELAQGFDPDAVLTPELREHLMHALNRLPEPTQIVVAMRTIQGLKGKEVARLLQCSESEVSRRLQEGIDQLRDMLRE